MKGHFFGHGYVNISEQNFDYSVADANLCKWLFEQTCSQTLSYLGAIVYCMIIYIQCTLHLNKFTFSFEIKHPSCYWPNCHK